MQRTVSLPVVVHCPHHGRTVRATRNAAVDRLVSCSEAEACRASETPQDGKVFPRGCAVYPSLAK